MPHSPARPLRCTLVWLTATTLLLGGASLLARDLHLAVAEVRRGNLADQTFDTLLVWLCSFVAVSCLVWLWITSTAVIVLAARGATIDNGLRRLPGCPHFVRRAVLIACGAAVVGSMVVPANAATPSDAGGAHSHRDQSGHTVDGRTLVGLPLPERAVRHGQQAVRTPQVRILPIASGAPADTVRVHPGDTLWSIAAYTLDPRASTGQINQRWHDIYELNRAVIGADPNVIFPGQELRLHEA